MADPSTVEEWLSLAAQHEHAARLLIDDKKAAAQGWWHCGMAAEAALKGYILWSKRPNNEWAAYALANGLKTHDLRKLIAHADISLSADSSMAASWHMMVSWDHRQRYDPQRMPRTVAKSMYNATFGSLGTVTWIRSKLTLKG